MERKQDVKREKEEWIIKVEQKNNEEQCKLK